MARAAAKPKDRRGTIAWALYRCISRKGYANTTLKDVAEQAGMSPSHVGYYFDNKAAILEDYAAGICAANLASLPDLAHADPQRRADALADFCLGEGQMNTALLGVIQELNGLSVHDARLHTIKAKHSTALREYFERFFAGTELAGGLSIREAAWLAHATLDGLNTNTLFDSDLSRALAHGLFRRALRAIMGLDGPGTGSDRPRQPARAGGGRKNQRKGTVR